jgi:penicillin-binding protein 2
VTPRMLKSGSDLVNHSSTRALKNIDSISDANWKLIIDSMVKVVHRGNQGYGENGTAWVYIGRDIPYQMAGKSGTAQVVGIAQGEQYKAEDLDEYQRKHAWFIAFAPVEDPVIAIAVLIENGGGGSEMAAPIARQVIDHYLLGSDRIRLAGASQ